MINDNFLLFIIQYQWNAQLRMENLHYFPLSPRHKEHYKRGNRKISRCRSLGRQDKTASSGPDRNAVPMHVQQLWLPAQIHHEIKPASFPLWKERGEATNRQLLLRVGSPWQATRVPVWPHVQEHV